MQEVANQKRVEDDQEADEVHEESFPSTAGVVGTPAIKEKTRGDGL